MIRLRAILLTIIHALGIQNLTDQKPMDTIWKFVDHQQSNFQDPIDGGTSVPYFRPYFMGRFPDR